MHFPGVRNRPGDARWARVILGALFLTTGIAKVPVLREFGIALESILGVGPAVASWAAAGVGGVEIAVGLTLLLGTRVGLAGLCSLLMAAAFAAIQTARLLRGAGTPCYCFGILGNLPAGIELGLDILLIVLSILALRGRSRDVGVPAGSRAGRSAWLALIIPACVLSIPLALPETPATAGEAILRKLDAAQQAPPPQKREVVLCLNLDDFHCSLCFDDLLVLLDTLRSINSPAGTNVPAAILRLSPPDSSGWRLHRWARETGIGGPIAVVPADEYDAATGGRSLLWIAVGRERVVKSWELPLGAGRREEAIASMKW